MSKFSVNFVDDSVPWYLPMCGFATSASPTPGRVVLVVKIDGYRMFAGHESVVTIPLMAGPIVDVSPYNE